jgi:uncharacterized protein YoxC
MKADIFFFITSIAVALMTILFLIVLVYAIKILKNFKEISDIARSTSEIIAADLEELREKMKTGPKVSTIVDFVKDAFTGEREKKARPHKKATK